MTRLTHSYKAYLRFMQISDKNIFAFVEGKIVDPYFYGKICEFVCQTNNLSYRICRSQEINGNGGKQVLLTFFEYLKRNSALVQNFKGKSIIVIFFLDKDVDDYLRIQRHSENLVYTQYYDIENHIFIHGNLVQAISASTSMDNQEVLNII